MENANALSRHEDHMIGIEEDSKGVLVILLEHVRQNQVLICDEGNKIYKKIKEATLKLLESKVFTISKDWKEEDGVIMKDKQMYVPDEKDAQLQVVKLHHNTPVAGHPSYEKTIELLQRTYFWPGMTSFIKDYISRCDRCARFKGMNQASFGTLNPLKQLEYLVHWSGFNKEDRTWEPEGQLDNACDIIIDFHQANPSTPWKLRMSYIDFLGLFKPYKNDTVTCNKDAPFDCLEVDP